MESRQAARSTPVTPPPTTRARSKSGRFSFRSDKSKESPKESSAEKKKTHMSNTTKANPNAAISEAQPIALALEKTTLSSLQNIRCNDVFGNPINDPDRSNPTRWRMERPLETIRSFEIAIDREYSHRQSMLIHQSTGGAQSRRTSYLGGSGANGSYDQGPRHSGGQGNGGYGNAGYGASRDSFGDNGYNPPRGDSRMQSDPMLSKYGPPPGVYPAVGSSRSRDTLNTGGSSGSEHFQSAGAGSEDSSVERAHGVSRPLPHQQRSGYMDAPDGYTDDNRSNLRYGQRPGGYNGPPSGHTAYNKGGQYGSGPDGIVPRPPGKDIRQQSMQKKAPIKLSTTEVPDGAVQSPTQEARQSWFKKRFSKGK